MSIFIKKDKKRAALEKEYASVLKKETQLKQSAMKTTAPRWKTVLEKKVPEGIGLPDIVVFVGMLLKGVYKTALSYGFAYDTPEERLFILRMMETALTKGPDFAVKNARVDGMIEEMPQTGEDELQAQIQKTGSAFAVDMLLLKFVQGFPLVGILGGAANPVYYNKVMRYVQLKYQKRYLLAVAQRNGYSLRFL